MKKNLLLLLLALFNHFFAFSNENDSLLLELEKAIKTRANYDAEKLLKISNIKQLLYEPNTTKEQTYYINNQIIKEYESYNFDSTLHYVEKNLDIATSLNNQELLNITRLNLAHLLASSGRYKESDDVLGLIRVENLPKDALHIYYDNYRNVYNELGIHSTLNENTHKYKKLTKLYRDSLLAILPPSSYKALSIIEEQFIETGDFMKAMQLNSKRLKMFERGTREYSMITYQRSRICEQERNTELQKKFLILSAISDIECSVKDNASLTLLAMILHNEKDIDRAYRYINISFEDALFFNSRLRFVTISNILPYITESYQIMNNKQKKNLRVSLIIISLLGLILLFSVIYIYRQMKNLSRARNELQVAINQLKDLNNNLHEANAKLSNLNNELFESNHVKEQYIANFLRICSNYIDKLDSYKKKVHKQIAARKVSELFESTKSNQLIEDELKEFYKNFDDTFLSIYPAFVKKVNALLQPDEQIILKKGELLNTELRIFALIRLGISDSSKIAKLLRYSNSTIYNYRVKVKNKAAVERDDFENYIMKISPFSKNTTI